MCMLFRIRMLLRHEQVLLEKTVSLAIYVMWNIYHHMDVDENDSLVFLSRRLTLDERAVMG